MTKNPILNALAAFGYILIVALIMNLATHMTNQKDSFIDPVAVVSLFTLSAAVMGYIFFFQPFQLYFDNKKKQALNLFFQTVGVFAIITVVVLVLLFTRVL